MKLLLVPLFDTSGVNVISEISTKLPFYFVNTQLCIYDRCFYHAEKRFFTLPGSKDNENLLVGGKETKIFPSEVRIMVTNKEGKHSYETLPNDGFGEKLCYLTAGDLKEVGFKPVIEDKLFEETLAIKYIEALPDEAIVLTIPYT